MGKKSKIRHVVKRVRAFYKQTDKLILEMKKGYDSPCVEGCDHCCYQLLSSCIPEAITALYSVWDNPKLREDFSSKIPQLVQQVEFLRRPDASNKKWFSWHIPCVFLQDRKCVIYEDRPLMCRTHISAEKTAERCTNMGYTQNLKLINKKKPMEKIVELSVELNSKFGIPWSFRPFQQSLLDAWDVYVLGVKTKKLSDSEELAVMCQWAQLELRS